MPSCLPFLLPLPCLMLLSAVLPIIQSHEYSITGDLTIWDEIFASRSPIQLLDGPENDLTWTEGPVLVGGELFFSDTVEGNIYALGVGTEEGKNGEDDGQHHVKLRVVRERSGDNPPEEDNWRAEPGSNGLAVLPPSTEEHSRRQLLVCQHGARRLGILDVDSPIGRIRPVVSEFEGRRLNGPNDVVLRRDRSQNRDASHYYAYFTDPVYAFLEKDRFSDMPYLDESVTNDGAGRCGVYRVRLERDDRGVWSGVRDEDGAELIATMNRPNGIGFIGDDLIVADCCQGLHLENCQQGMSRWAIYRLGGEEKSWHRLSTIEDAIPPVESMGGCADGFAVHGYEDKNGNKRRVLIASCSDGLCVVDVDVGKILVRLWTTSTSGGGKRCRISNVHIGDDRRAYLTGNCGIMYLPLQVRADGAQEAGSKSEL